MSPIYPKYVSGGAWLYPYSVADRLLYTLKSRPYFHVDDALISGVLAELADVPRICLNTIGYLDDFLRLADCRPNPILAVFQLPEASILKTILDVMDSISLCSWLLRTDLVRQIFKYSRKRLCFSIYIFLVRMAILYASQRSILLIQFFVILIQCCKDPFHRYTYKEIQQINNRVGSKAKRGLMEVRCGPQCRVFLLNPALIWVYICASSRRSE